MQDQATPKARKFARELRKAMTDSERRLWSRLRRDQLGFNFRRQHPIGNYIVDFACLSPALVIELDGSQHADNNVYDATRDAFLRSRGFTVLRFATDAPLRHMDGVLETIFATLDRCSHAAPTPTLPQRGREPRSPT